MSTLSPRWNERWRVFVVVAALALAFAALERIELSVFDLFGAENLLARTRPAGEDAKLRAEADALASRSTAAGSMPIRRACSRAIARCAAAIGAARACRSAGDRESEPVNSLAQPTS